MIAGSGEIGTRGGQRVAGASTLGGEVDRQHPKAGLVVGEQLGVRARRVVDRGDAPERGLETVVAEGPQDEIGLDPVRDVDQFVAGGIVGRLARKCDVRREQHPANGGEVVVERERSDMDRHGRHQASAAFGSAMASAQAFGLAASHWSISGLGLSCSPRFHASRYGQGQITPRRTDHS